MIIIKKAEDLQLLLEKIKNKSQSVGFIPTMGALHEGHISLIQTAKEMNDFIVCSVFVNRAQFNDAADYNRYPSTLEDDLYKLENNECDLVFIPAEREIYPGGIEDHRKYDLGYLESVLEGKYRPGHFQGVCMVMDKLLQIVKPDDLYLGQKDFQQCMVIKKLIEENGWSKQIKVHICPIVREADGLAMSSRNRLLDDEERELAPEIFKALMFVRENFQKIPLENIKKQAVERLNSKQFKVDYVEIADADSLIALNDSDKGKKAVGLVAAYLDHVRLIDNILIAQD
jgi:pantoate--beta-alanine ligase